jgi:hypothetical protein
MKVPGTGSMLAALSSGKINPILGLGAGCSASGSAVVWALGPLGQQTGQIAKLFRRVSCVFDAYSPSRFRKSHSPKHNRLAGLVCGAGNQAVAILSKGSIQK